MSTKISRNVQFLSVGFLLIFFGFDGIQQYVTTYFDSIGIQHVGFISLIILYSVFTLMGPLTAVIVSRIGAKRSMLIAVGFYVLYCLSLITKTPPVIYAASVLLGAAGSMLWTAQNSYLIRASDSAAYGANAGFFSTLFAIGAASGVFLFGLLLPVLGYATGFTIFAFMPLIGVVLLSQLQDIRVEVKNNKWREMRRALTSITALRVCAIWFSFNFIQGLMLGAIPLEIKRAIGLWAIGILGGIFYIMPMLFAYIFGKFSDLRGRRGIITLMYALSIIGVALMFGAGTPLILLLAIFVLAFNFGISRTIAFALVGDISTETNVESLTALTWMVQTIAFLCALGLSVAVQGYWLYLVSLAGIVASYFWFFPIRKLPLTEIRERITREIGTY